MVRVIEVVGAVFTSGDKVFAARRGPGKSMAGKWEFPGGKVEPGESAEEALRRELLEELRVDAAVGSHLASTRHDTGDTVIVLSTFECELRGGTPTMTEHIALRWVPRSELHLLDWAPADVPTVQLLQEEEAAADD
ncbi:(deoxy)nucleoside triphosphate pyrophosphohydrolase [Corynebacterium senegalense]|uniref:(deoxy)nucleoside triphosphate pyrophosphohydrolase n=1 Tax=Corynebacterium senegalense TaxID=2080750 RepID=UPI000E20738D|nr:(deoxy)nucleoside triphosphate pyrophosphohydrolase [Corynebacterium senegalense]